MRYYWYILVHIVHFSRKHWQQPEIQVVHGQKPCLPWARKAPSPYNFQIQQLETRLRQTSHNTVFIQSSLCSPWPSSLSHLRSEPITDGFIMIYPWSTNLIKSSSSWGLRVMRRSLLDRSFWNSKWVGKRQTSWLCTFKIRAVGFWRKAWHMQRHATI